MLKIRERGTAIVSLHLVYTRLGILSGDPLTLGTSWEMAIKICSIEMNGRSKKVLEGGGRGRGETVGGV